MAEESLWRRRIKISERFALPLQKMAKVRRHPKIAYRAQMRVSVSLERSSKAIDVLPAGTAAQTL
jgi:hypothetical protein